MRNDDRCGGSATRIRRRAMLLASALVLVACICLLGTFAFEEDSSESILFEYDHDTYSIISEKNKEVEIVKSVRYYGEVHDYVEYDGEKYKVTSIRSHAFEESGYREIVLPNTITNIGEAAFIKGLFSSVTLPKNLKTIPESAFQYSSLRSVTIPDSVESIEDFAFANCPSLNTVSLGKVRSIGPAAFAECGQLEGVVIPDTVEFLGNGAFAYCENMSFLTIPIGLNAVSDPFSPAFANDYKLREFTFTAGKSGIGCDYYSYDGSYNTAKYQKVTPWYMNRSHITHITLSSGITYLGECMFQDMSSLKSVVFPDTLKSIGKTCFANCTSLEELNFESCKKLDVIGDVSFYQCGSLKNINIPVVNTLGWNSFAYCEELENVVLGDVRCIGRQAFDGCIELQNFQASSVEQIDNQAFFRCFDLVQIYLIRGESIKVEGGAFSSDMRFVSSVPGLVLSMYQDANLTVIIDASESFWDYSGYKTVYLSWKPV